MKERLIKTCALFLAIVVVICAVPSVSSQAAGQLTYSKTSNSGLRDEICTSLEGTSASSYYTGSNVYDTLSEKSSSEILSALRSLMISTHTKTTSYNDCKSYAEETDGERNGTKLVTLYTSYTTSYTSAINREHVWPKSLGGYETSGPGADLHHIRPSDTKLNSTRNNNKYGEVTNGKAATGSTLVNGMVGGYYGGGFFEPLDNVKGDVARICLYVYARWGGSYTGCSNITNVFQSVEVLLEWCEMDPVDTWEMGRNEVVEEIQGNRNVFIDYPELAWLLFDEEIPTDMQTPSGNAMNGTNTPAPCEHENTEIRGYRPASTTENGYTGDTYCVDCGKLITLGESIPMIEERPDHSAIIEERRRHSREHLRGVRRTRRSAGN